MTLRQAEEETGLSKDTISRLERGLRTPQPLTAAKLAEAYGRSIEEFLESPKAPAPPPLNNSEERGSYPYPWMGDTLARLIDGWDMVAAVPPENPLVSYAVSVGAMEALKEVLRYDIPGETLRDRVPEDEVEERAQLAKKLDRVLRRANEHYAASKDADSAEVRELFDAEADIRRRTQEIA
jgi:transcriptional regulator with XRE-family HTH domain